MKEVDYIFKTAKPIEWQKWFNQWKHDFNIEVLHCHTIDEDKVMMFIERTKL